MIDEHFTVHETSNLIHPLGWSKRTGHDIEASQGTDEINLTERPPFIDTKCMLASISELQTEIDKIIETNVYPAGIVPPHIFHQV